MDELYFIDPLSVAANGFDVFDITSTPLSIASLGFIKLQVKSITRKGGGGDQWAQYPAPSYDPWKKKEPLPNLWKDVEQPEIADLEKIKELLQNVQDDVEIVLEPLNDTSNIEIALEPIKQAFESVFPANKISINLNQIVEPAKPVTEIKITLEALNI